MIFYLLFFAPIPLIIVIYLIYLYQRKSTVNEYVDHRTQYFSESKSTTTDKKPYNKVPKPTYGTPAYKKEDEAATTQYDDFFEMDDDDFFGDEEDDAFAAYYNRKKK